MPAEQSVAATGPYALAHRPQLDHDDVSRAPSHNVGSLSAHNTGTPGRSRDTGGSGGRLDGMNDDKENLPVPLP